MSRTYTVFLFILCVLCNSIAMSAIPLDFDENNNANLEGLWNYYPDHLIFDLKNNNKSLPPSHSEVQLPSSFYTISGHKDGFASFQQKFILPENAIKKHIYIYVPYQYGAYELYVDGRMIAQVGEVGDHLQHKTMLAPKVTSFFSQNKEIEITLQASSFKHIRGGLENPVYIGFSHPILHKFYRQVIPLSLMSGILLMTGSFMLLFALYRRPSGYLKNPILFLSLFILCLSLRSFFAVPFLYSLFTNISWLWGTRAEYLLTEFACLFFILYLYLLPKNLIHRYIFNISIVLILCNILITFTQQPLIFQDFFFKGFAFSGVIFLNLLYSIYRIFKTRTPFSKLNAFAITLLCLTFLHDYLLGLKLIDSVEISFYSSCVYFICVTFQLSRDYANKSFESERLNHKLLQLNKSLDNKVLERTQTVNELNRKLELQVRTDALTGSFNRHALNHEIQKRYERARAQHHSLAFFMIDVDYFKNYNDYYGHLKGDDILKNLVQALNKILPKNAFFARYGGEEFAIILSGIPLENVHAVANQCLMQVRRQMWEHANRPDHKSIVTISIGAAVMDEQHVYSNLYDLMKIADQQLYQAKNHRDSVSIHS